MRNGHRYRFALEPGYKLLWYEINSVLGQGGFGITYLARDTNLNHWVAIKEFLPSGLASRSHESKVEPISEGHSDTYGWGLQRFVSEARTLVKFRHPNIVLIHNVFEANNTAYMVMEYVEGRTLEDAFKFRKVEGETEYKRIILALLDGLELVHNAGFIHRDIKPDNIFLREDGTPVLLDFGSARQALGGKTRTLTALVSSGYAPYEQYDSSKSGETKQGPWTDIYALGATLYCAVSGKGPIDAMARVNAAMEGEDLLEPASKVAKGAYSDGFLQAIDWALELRPKRRPQTASEWRKVLTGDHQHDAVTAVADVSQSPPIELPQTPPAAIPKESPAAETAKHDDTDKADTSPSLELPARKAIPKPAAPKPAPPKAGPEKSRSAMVPIAAVAILTAIAGAVYFGGLIPEEKSEVASPAAVSPSAPEREVAVAEESLSPEEVARRRAEKARQKAALLQKQLEEQQRLAQAEAKRLTELEAARERAERSAQLLAEAESDLEAGRFIAPEKGNAFFRFKELLALDPENTNAKDGLERVVAGVVGLANAAMEKQEFGAAENQLAQAEVVSPGSELIAKARAELEQAKQAAEEERRRIAEAKQREAEEAARRKAAEERQAKIKTLRALAEQDLKAGRLVSPEGNNALVRFREVLTLDEQNAAAMIGVEAVVTDLVTLGSDAANRNDFDHAGEYLKQAAAIDPKSKRVLEARTALAKARQGFEAKQRRLAEEERKRAAAAETIAAESEAEKEVGELLAKAENDLKVLRLTSPAGANAYERYQRALELDPGNAEAEAGILKIGEKYLELKDRALARKNFDKAKGYLDEAEVILPGSELVAMARDEYEIARAEYEQAQAERTAAEASSREAEQLAKAQTELERLKAEQERLRQRMQSQRAPQPAAPAATDQVIKIAIMPIGRGNMANASTGGDHDAEVAKHVDRLFGRENGFKVVYDGHHSEPLTSLISGNMFDYWEGVVTRTPRLPQVASALNRLGADLALMISYDVRPSGNNTGIWYPATDVYLVDKSGNQLVHVREEDQDLGYLEGLLSKALAQVE